MKKIKAIAVLTAMTLTFSIFATAASAVDIDYIANTAANLTNTPITEYTRDDFKANLANAKYAALFDFTGGGTVTKQGTTYVAELQAPVQGTSESDNCTINFTGEWGATSKNWSCLYLKDLASWASDENTNNASGMSYCRINAGSKATLSFTNPENLKPIAIGCEVTSYKNNSTSKFECNVKVYLTGEDEPAFTQNNAFTSTNTLLRFLGYKAPVGKTIDRIEISNENGTEHLRIDDLCVVYDEASNIEKGMRFSADEGGYVEINSISQLGDKLYLNAASKYADKKYMVFYAAYDANNEIIKLSIATSGKTMTVKTITDIKDKIKTVKAFVWDKSALTPQALNATIE